MTVITRFRELYKDLANVKPQDLERVYHEKIVFDDPVTTHSGLVDVKRYFANLLENATSCKFTIHQILDCDKNNEQHSDSIDHVVIWTMESSSKVLKKGKTLRLDGTTMLRIEDDLIVYHRDYYDLGQMIYEHIPILSFVIKAIKKRLSA